MRRASKSCAPGKRSYVDLDLLVRHDDILSAAHQMLALGFEPAFPLAALHAGKIPGEYLFRRPGTQRIIKLHTERSFRYYPVPLPLADFFARQRRVALDGRDVPVLSLEDEFVLNCIHGAKHFWERFVLRILLLWFAVIPNWTGGAQNRTLNTLVRCVCSIWRCSFRRACWGHLCQLR
jgi:hypothetical protein